MMSIRDAMIVSLLAISIPYCNSSTTSPNSSTTSANSCANVTAFSSNDVSGLQQSQQGIYSTGTFRIECEADEGKQPMFNLAKLECEKQADFTGGTSLVCKVTRANVWASAEKPDTENPNCSLDLDSSSYTMKELQKGILTGIDDSTSCFNTQLTVDRNTQRVYLSFTRTQYADEYDKIQKGTCGAALPRTEVLMNCTMWPRMRKGLEGTPPRYCDFSNSSSHE